MDINPEESATLQSSGGAAPRHHKRTSPYLLQTDVRRRVDSVRLPCWCYATWTVHILFATLIPVYAWFIIDEPDCWSARHYEIMMSVFFSMLASIVGLLLFVSNCLVRSTISYWRLNFCTLAFIVLTIISISNFLTGVFLFSKTTCYFEQLIPLDRIVTIGQAERDLSLSHHTLAWLEKVAVKYDLKIVGVLHMFVCLGAFATSMGFAIVKNNFKYIQHVDFD